VAVRLDHLTNIINVNWGGRPLAIGANGSPHFEARRSNGNLIFTKDDVFTSAVAVGRNCLANAGLVLVAPDVLNTWVYKLGDDGGVIWAVQTDVLPAQASSGVTFDPDGNIIAAQYHPSPSGVRFRKLSSATGAVLWAVLEGDFARTPRCDGSGNVAYLSTLTTIKKRSPSGALLWSKSSGGDTYSDHAFDNSGNLIAAVGARVEKYNSGGSLTLTISVDFPITVDCDGSGNIWIGDGDVARKYSPDGAPLASIPLVAQANTLSVLGSGIAVLTIDNVVTAYSGSGATLWTATPAGAFANTISKRFVAGASTT
jgi:hypothetical protein